MRTRFDIDFQSSRHKELESWSLILSVVSCKLVLHES